MLVIGLTGSIGTGKSVAADYLARLGGSVIDADQVGHEAYTPQSDAWHKVVGAFGDEILEPNKEINRNKLGAIVFSNPDQLARLNQIMHPMMACMVENKIKDLRGEGAEVVVLEAALLFEAGWDSLVQEVWVIDSPEELVIQRLSDRNGFTQQEIRKRISSQMDRSERLSRADCVINNSGDIPQMESAIDDLWNSRVKGRNERSNG